MFNTQLIDLLKSIPPEWLEEADLYLQSRFHNRGQRYHDICALFTLLKPFHPNYDHPSLERTAIYAQLFPGQEVIKGKLEKVISDTLGLVRSFLLHQYYNRPENNFQHTMDWAQVLKTLGKTDKYEHFMEKAKQDLFTETNFSNKYFLQKLQFEYEILSWRNMNNTTKGDINLANTFSALLNYYEVARLEISNLLLIQQKFTMVAPTDDILAAINQLPLLPIDQNILLEISTQINQLLNNERPSLDDFHYLMNLLLVHEDKIAPLTLRDYYTYLRNICSLLINKGDASMSPILHQLHRDNLNRGYLTVNNKLHILTLSNINRAALFVGNVDWASEFVEEYKDRLFGDQNLNDHYLLNKALCLFARKEFDEALSLLPHTLNNFVNHLLARRLEIMCYYEIRSDILMSKLDAFKVYVWRASNKSLSPAMQDANKSFVNLLYQLISTQPGDNAKLKRLLAKLENPKDVAEYSWLSAKITALMKK